MMSNDDIEAKNISLADEIEAKVCIERDNDEDEKSRLREERKREERKRARLERCARREANEAAYAAKFDGVDATTRKLAG